MSSPVASNEVHLAIYDLSRGMARQLSAQFLGSNFAIDAIPHTGVVVYGQEYFFGAGIQSESPALFRQMTGMMPVQLLAVGRTTVTQAEFERWCGAQMTSGRFSAQAYDLLRCNCNHFAHTASIEGLGLSTGVPDWVLQVPQRFLASPMGQLVRPMLDQMQLRAPVQGAHDISRATAKKASNSNVSSQSALNPWANLKSSSATTTVTGTSAIEKPATGDLDAKSKAYHPILDSFTKPLISKDDKTVGMSIQKIIKNQDDPTAQFLQYCQTALVNHKPLTLDDNTRLGQILHTCLQERHAVTFVLMLLRILVVQGKETRIAYQDCLDWIRANVLEPDGSCDGSKLTTPARTMGWLVLSNFTSLALLWKENQADEEFWLQAGISALRESDSPIRQASAAFLYNVALLLPQDRSTSVSEGLSDTCVSLLAATLEGLSAETDDTTRLRRLMTAARVLVPLNQEPVYAAVKLVMDLGLQEPIGEQESMLSNMTGDAGMSQKLASEVNNILLTLTTGTGLVTK